jgi:hypothetical protein
VPDRGHSAKSLALIKPTRALFSVLARSLLCSTRPPSPSQNRRRHRRDSMRRRPGHPPPPPLAQTTRAPAHPFHAGPRPPLSAPDTARRRRRAGHRHSTVLDAAPPPRGPCSPRRRRESKVFLVQGNLIEPNYDCFD